MKRKIFIIALISGFFFSSFLMAQYAPNHPELTWHTVETDHFIFHYHDGTEWTVQQAMTVAESVYPHVTGLYDWEPKEKTHIVIQDTDDYANGGAYYFDNKILLWASPLEFELRGNHNWMWNVLTHEFSHIISLGASMKYSINIPMAYIQWIDREIPVKENVILEYPKGIGSIPIANSIIPMWWAEGVAQFQYMNAGHDVWDSHRDMILRDALLHENCLSWADIGHFGHKGIGNERVYNTGFAFVDYMAREYGQTVHHDIAHLASKKSNIRFRKILHQATGNDGKKLYNNFIDKSRNTYLKKTETIRKNIRQGEEIFHQGPGNFQPLWSPDGKIFVIQSTRGSDYISAPVLYHLKADDQLNQISKLPVRGHAAWSPDSRYLYFAQQQKPDKYGSVWFDLMRYDFNTETSLRLTQNARVYSAAVAQDAVYLITVDDGTHNIVKFIQETGELLPVTAYDTGQQIFTLRLSPDGETLYFDMAHNHGRDIYKLDTRDNSIKPLISDPRYDNRSPFISSDGRTIIYSSDRTGIFNIYSYDLRNAHSDLLTNVTGGAMYPAINAKNGALTYTLFNESEFAIYQISDPEPLNPDNAAYSDYSLPVKSQKKVIKKDLDSRAYENQFTNLFLMPFLQYDYDALKYGLIFYQNEILDKMSLFAMADINHRGDYDFNIRLDFNQFLPRFFAETYFVGLGQEDSVSYLDYWEMEQDIKFSLNETTVGTHYTWNGHFIQLAATQGSYTSRIKGSLPEYGLVKFVPSTYYKGQKVELLYKKDFTLRQWQRNISPTRGVRINKVLLAYDFNHFIDGFKKTDYGTYEEEYLQHYTARAELDADLFLRIPGTKHSALSFNANMGYMENAEIDSFFNYYAGGMPGLKGYPYYTIEGSNKAILTSTLRFPVAKSMDISFEPFTIEALYLGVYHQIGDAWTGPRNGRIWKQNAGVEARIKGHSWYGFPLAISLDAVYAFNDVEYLHQNEIRTVGHNWRFYWRILFDF